MYAVHRKVQKLYGILVLLLCGCVCKANGINIKSANSGTAVLRAGKLPTELEKLKERCDASFDPWSRSPRCAIVDYIAFHAEAKRSKRARYLVWTCFGSDRADDNVQKEWCGGFGDRMRGIEYALRLAQLTQRVLLVHQEVPAPMETFMVPGAIDWTLTEDLGVELTRDVRHLVVGDDSHSDNFHNPLTAQSRQIISNGTLKALDDRIITIATNYDSLKPSGPKAAEVYYANPAASDLVQALFKFSPAVEERIASLARQLGFEEGRPYVAVHLRMGHLLGEHSHLNAGPGLRNATDEDVLRVAQQCALQLTRQIRGADAGEEVPAGADDASAQRYLLLTDKSDLRKRVVHGEVSPWVAPNIPPLRFSTRDAPSAAQHQHRFQSVEEEVEALMLNLASVGLLSRATCIIHTQGDIVLQARLLGRNTCHPPLNTCLSYKYREAKAHPAGH